MRGGIWLDADPNKYISYDGSHLQNESVDRLSKELAEKIKMHLRN
jgi:hypothetical protein